MKGKKQVLGVALLLITTFSYAGGKKEETPAPSLLWQTWTPVTPSESETSAPQATPYFTGDGGKGMRLAVLEPTGNGLSPQEQWVLSQVQGSITADFNRFSAITIIDRQNLEKILAEQTQSLSGNYSEQDYVRLGNLTNARLILAGTIRKTANNYMLELAVTDAESGERRASYPPKAVSLIALENNSAAREATADMLKQLGVNLTAAALQELKTIENDTTKIQAENALARGIAAQRKGTEVEALSYFFQAAAFDPTLAEAGSRLNILTANVTSGNIGENVRNDIQWRDQWVARLKECEEFYTNYLKETPPYYLVYSPNIKQGAVDYEKRTVSLTVESIAAYPEIAWFSTINQVVQTVRQGLMATKRADVWGLDKWPAQSVSTPNPFTNYVSGFWVEVEILNSEGKSINAKETVFLPSGWEVVITEQVDRDRKGNQFTIVEINYAKPIGEIREIDFPAADPNAITDNLSVRITAIDGIPAETAAQQKRINILTAAQYAKLPNARTSPQKPGNQNSAWSFFRIDTQNSSAMADLWIIDNDKNSNIRLANIRHGVTSIERYALMYKQVTSVFIPNSVTSIEENAFRNNRLTSVAIPNSVTSIGIGAFSNNRLTSVTIPNSITSIGRSAFAGNQLTSVTIGANINIEYREYTFTPSFDQFYRNNGKKAGTYTYDESNKSWSYRAR